MTLSSKSLEERLTPSSKQVPRTEFLTEMYRAVKNSSDVQFVRFRFPSVMKTHARSLDGVIGA